jgi:hypothetical protein
MEESFVKLEAAMKLFAKRGMSKIAQEVELNGGMESSFELIYANILRYPVGTETRLLFIHEFFLRIISDFGAFFEG